MRLHSQILVDPGARSLTIQLALVTFYLSGGHGVECEVIPVVNKTLLTLTMSQGLKGISKDFLKHQEDNIKVSSCLEATFDQFNISSKIQSCES